MAKKKKKDEGNLLPSFSGFDIDPDTQRGVLSIILLACGLITAFSIFGLAGDIGNVVNIVLTNIVGVGRYVVPIIFFLVVYRLLYPSDNELSPIYLFGLVMFGFSIFGLMDVISPNAGGYIGTANTYIFRQFSSIIVAVVVFVALLIISILIVFNTSLDRLAERIPAGTIIGKSFRFILSLFSSARHRISVARERALAEVESDINEDDELMEDDNTDDISDESEEVSARTFSSKHITGDDEDTEIVDADEDQPERIHLSHRHRKIDLPFDLLSNKKGKPTSGDIESNKEIIQQTLHNFSINVEMGPVSVGPTVTQYTFKPAKGVKVAQILSLQNDLALALAAHPIRIEAPIPGQSLVGVEVPNIMAARVGLRELLESSVFKKRKTNLALMFGRNVAGEVYVDYLDSMPHLLIAGATGSGKSVCLNTIILSLLYQNGPDDLKIIMVDPKRVEFTMYNEIPHLLTPVITDVQKTINALKWCVNEMDRRYEVLSHSKKRDINSYNQTHPNATMPYIVFIVDELADLMATAPREVESAIVRLAQMARAVGIHLILATQRPSVDVITGLIKANITSRCAFNTASLVDSRTILDMSGAEKLLGKGDMLYVSAATSKPRRVQGTFVTEVEVQNVVNYLKAKAKANYDDEVVNIQASSALPQAFNEGSDDDELIPKAKEIVVNSQKASASLLQRRLRIGYARAARILDIMEEQGFIGPANGAKPREILIDQEQYEAGLSNSTDDIVDDYEEERFTNDVPEEDDEDTDDDDDVEVDDDDESDSEPEETDEKPKYE